MKMEREEIAALPMEELVHLAVRVQDILRTILHYVQSIASSSSNSTELNMSFDFQPMTDCVTSKPQEMSKAEVEQLVLRCQECVALSPIKPGCRCVYFSTLH